MKNRIQNNFVPYFNQVWTLFVLHNRSYASLHEIKHLKMFPFYLILKLSYYYIIKIKLAKQ